MRNSCTCSILSSWPTFLPQAHHSFPLIPSSPFPLPAPSVISSHPDVFSLASLFFTLSTCTPFSLLRPLTSLSLLVPSLYTPYCLLNMNVCIFSHKVVKQVRYGEKYMNMLILKNLFRSTCWHLCWQQVSTFKIQVLHSQS